ncbi:MAG: hypothetical protein IT373_13275 [Polyangiaceae bacterium]|nr:hypothetical protein [Polyangiaceae bacterium]
METLAGWVRRHGALGTTDAVGWAVRLAKSLERMHARGEVHARVSARALRVADEACTAQGELALPRHLPDDPAYHSPERASGQAPTPADDTWALGVTLYFALTGVLPFPGDSDADVRERILWRPASPLSVYDAGTAELEALMARVLARDPAHRTSDVRDLREVLCAHLPAYATLPRLAIEGEAQGGDDDVEISVARMPSPAPAPREPAPSRPAIVPPAGTLDDESADDEATMIATRDELTRGETMPARSGSTDRPGAAFAATRTYIGVGPDKPPSPSDRPATTGVPGFRAPPKLGPLPHAHAAPPPTSKGPPASAAPGSTAAPASRVPPASAAPGSKAPPAGRVPPASAAPGSKAPPASAAPAPGSRVPPARPAPGSRVPPARPAPGSQAPPTSAAPGSQAAPTSKAPPPSGAPGMATPAAATAPGSGAGAAGRPPAVADSTPPVSQRPTRDWLPAATASGAEPAPPSERPTLPMERAVEAEPAPRPGATHRERERAFAEEVQRALVAARSAASPTRDQARRPPRVDEAPEIAVAEASSPGGDERDEAAAAPGERAPVSFGAPPSSALPRKLGGDASPVLATWRKKSPARTYLPFVAAGLAGLAVVGYFVLRQPTSTDELGSRSSTAAPPPTATAPATHGAGTSATHGGATSARPSASTSPTGVPSASASAPPPPPSASASAPPPPPPPSASASAPPPPPSASASAPPPPPPPSASAPPPPPPGDLADCVRPLFPPDTFGADAKLDFVCAERDVVRGAQALRTAVVTAGRGRGPTDAMREWAQLGWYKLAVFTALRVRCCPGAPEVAVPAAAAKCQLAEAASALGRAAVLGDDAAVGSAVKDFQRAADCLSVLGGAALAGEMASPGPGEYPVFTATVKRCRALR